jgi:hypothetical protein
MGPDLCVGDGWADAALTGGLIDRSDLQIDQSFLLEERKFESRRRRRQRTRRRLVSCVCSVSSPHFRTHPPFDRSNDRTRSIPIDWIAWRLCVCVSWLRGVSSFRCVGCRRRRASPAVNAQSLEANQSMPRHHQRTQPITNTFPTTQSITQGPLVARSGSVRGWRSRCRPLDPPLCSSTDPMAVPP